MSDVQQDVAAREWAGPLLPDEGRRLAHQAYAPMVENPVRDAAIVAAVAAGEYQRVVAARWGLSEGRVWQIVHRGQR